MSLRTLIKDKQMLSNVFEQCKEIPPEKLTKHVIVITCISLMLNFHDELHAMPMFGLYIKVRQRNM